MLGNAHAPNEAGTAKWRVRVDSGSFGNILGRHSSNLFYRFEVVLVDHLSPLIELLRAVLNEIHIGQPFVEDDLGHAVVESNVSARPRPQPQVGEVAHLDATGVDDNELRATLDHCTAHP